MAKFPIASIPGCGMKFSTSWEKRKYMPTFWNLPPVPPTYFELLSLENRRLFLHKHLTKESGGLIMKV